MEFENLKLYVMQYILYRDALMKWNLVFSIIKCIVENKIVYSNKIFLTMYYTFKRPD